MTYYGEHYKVDSVRDDCGLTIQHDETFLGAVQDIRDAVARAKAKGYHNDERWQIIRVEVVSEYGDDGVFKSRTTTETAVGMYDNGQVVRY